MVAQKTAKNFRGLLYFAAPGICIGVLARGHIGRQFLPIFFIMSEISRIVGKFSSQMQNAGLEIFHFAGR